MSRPEVSLGSAPEAGDAATTSPGPGSVLPPLYDVGALRAAEFRHLDGWTNLDNAASAPTPARALNRIRYVLEERIAVSQWLGRNAFELLAGFSKAAASLINAASQDEIVFVEGCSLGLNLVAQALRLEPGDNIVFCDQEYPANVYPWMSLQRDGVEMRQAPAVHGGLTLEALGAHVNGDTRVVAASAVQFFTGHRTDLAAVGEFCRQRDILFVVDAIQAAGHMPIDVRRMQIDVLVTGGHKSLLSLPGTGFMYVREAVCEALDPRVVGSLSTVDWSHYLSYDPTPHPGAWRFLIGTPNFLGMAGMVESIALVDSLTREAIAHHTTALAARALELAQERGYELTTTPGTHGPIATVKSKLGPDETSAAVQRLAAEERIAVARHLDREGQAHLRFSFHCYNTEAELACAFEALDRLA